MRRWIVVFVVLGIVSAACAGGSEDVGSTDTTPSTSGPTIATSEVVESTSTVPPETPTTGIEGAWPAVDVLVTNDDGVFLIDSTGKITQLVKGRVAYAIDDTGGGLLFQVERGRSDRSSTSGLADLDTTVWWVPRGAGEAQVLIVPTPGTGQDLTLSDAFADQDGSVQVVYVRSDTPPGYWDWFACTYYGDCPEVPTWYDGIHEDLIDRLRIYDLDQQSVTEAEAMGVFESGISGISAGGGQLVALFINQVGQDCALVDPMTAIEPPEGPARGLWAEWVWVPWIEAGCEGNGCPDICTLSPSGGLFGYTLGGRTLFVDTALGVERLVLDGRLIDLSDTHALVADGKPVIVVSVDDPTRTTTIPVAGHAHLAKSSIDIGGPVIPRTVAAIQLRPDGLGVVDFGDAVDDVVGTIIELLGPPESDWIAVPPWSQGGSCFSASGGFGCEDYFRSVSWGRGAVQLVFSDLHGFGDRPAFVGWSLGPGDIRLRTDEGLGVGSSVADVERVYGDEVQWSWDRPYGADFTIGRELMISGWIEGTVPSEGQDREGFVPDPRSRIEMLSAGAQGTP